jgi:hypothetical protein
MYLQRQQRRAILKDGDGFVRDPAGGCKVPEPFGRLEKSSAAAGMRADRKAAAMSAWVCTEGRC